jgi:hypothetical protein
MRDLVKRFPILLIFLVVPYGLFSQFNFRDSAEAYNYWAQRGIIELIYSSMQDNPNQLTDIEKEGKNKYNEKYIVEIDKENLTGIIKSFSEIEDFLNNNTYVKTSNSFFLPLKKAFEQKRPLNEQFFKVSNYYENPTNWNEKKTEILASYNNCMESLKPPMDLPQNKEKNLEAIQHKPPDSKNIIVWFWRAIGFLLGLIAGGFLIYQYSKSKIYSILDNEKYRYLDRLKQDTNQSKFIKKFFKYIGVFALLKLSKNTKKNTIKDCNKQIAQLQSQVEKIQSENMQKGLIITDQRITEDIKSSKIENIDNKSVRSYGIPEASRDIFFTIPEIDGSFKILNAKNYKEIDCFYKISLDESGQRGKLHYLSGEYDLRALDNIDYYLNPVCEIQNIMSRTFARKIVMTGSGSVIKRGDYWTVEDNKKVKIELV